MNSRSVVFALGVSASGLAGCSSPPTDLLGATSVFEPAADLTEAAHFFDLPYPLDTRLTAMGGPELSGFPNPNDNPLVDGLVGVASDRPQFPVVPVAYFQFDAALAMRDPSALHRASLDVDVLLVDVDPSSPERGRLIPTVSSTPELDAYVDVPLLTIAARPGFILTAGRKYAFVVTDSVLGEDGFAVKAAPAFIALRDGAGDASLAAEYEPVWQAVDALGLSRERVIVATVFTTGDVTARLSQLGDSVREQHDAELIGLHVDADDGASHPRFCELIGKMKVPQFQRGEPPFNTEGLFELDPAGALIVQRVDEIPIVVTIPKVPMPPGGYPLVVYFHGSGGLSSQVVDRGRVSEPEGQPEKGKGPAHVLAEHGFAMAGSAHPVNPERLPGASALAYLNFDNLPAFRDTFRQGVLEQRLYLDALLSLEVDPKLLVECDPRMVWSGSAEPIHFRAEAVFAMGQSMGGMYTNLVGATEPRIRGVVPTGAGGYWSHFILETTLVGGKVLIPILLGSSKSLSFMHPALHLLETAWEPVEPIVYMPRLAVRPLPEHPVRPVYEPVGEGDSYFPTGLFDAIALAYGHQQAGSVVWPSMQDALALDNKQGLADYPVSNNAEAASGTAYTGVVVQYEGDGIYDPHAIFAQLDAVKYQYGCFFKTLANSGIAVVPAPAALGTECPSR
ncbi:MAG: hypothetical protein EXR75_12680 [Myxococcales bacterium]|nr:hypothetical protein [Myxococcales bacterium]